MKKLLALYTPINPSRPYVGRLRKLHEANVKQNDKSLFDYFSEEVLLPHHLQKHGLWRGQNVIHHFNQFYERVKNDYHYIGKWDDDIILPPNILIDSLKVLRKSCFSDSSPTLIGCGLFQEDYGKPSILLEDALKEEGGEKWALTGWAGKPLGWYGAFSRFYIYRMDVWDIIPVECPWLHGLPANVEGEHSGDPDNSFQSRLKGDKHILDVPSIHLDHRAFNGRNDEYRVLLDLTAFFMSVK